MNKDQNIPYNLIQNKRKMNFLMFFFTFYPWHKKYRQCQVPFLSNSKTRFINSFMYKNQFQNSVFNTAIKSNLKCLEINLTGNV